MKLLRFINQDRQVCQGIWQSDGIHLVTGDFLDRFEPNGQICSESHIAHWLPPVQPANIIAVGLNYMDHIKEFGGSVPDHPCLFIKATTSLNAHLGPILLPKVAPDFVDFEAELAVVISRRAKHISPQDVPDYLLGYTLANDVTARDVQKIHDKQWARGKSFDTFCPVGPWIETELDPADLPIRSILNGQVMQESRTSLQIFSVNQLVSYISQSMTLLPGTLILTGTPPGVGYARDPKVTLKPHDSIVVEIDGLGRLENTVLPEDEVSV